MKAFFVTTLTLSALALSGCGGSTGSVIGTWTQSSSFNINGKPQTNKITLVISQNSSTGKNECSSDGENATVQITVAISISNSEITQLEDKSDQKFMRGGLAVCEVESENGHKDKFRVDGNTLILNEGTVSESKLTRQ